MYASQSFDRWGLGDVDVLAHDGRYHLFHLVLPNHAYIAHAVSRDGFSWHRVRNALYVGHPGSWDDDMLWTMHVSPDPDHPGRWRMFYSALSRRDRGTIQRIGLAESDDLLYWRKVDRPPFPLAIAGPDYEASTDQGRRWISFRDPFFCRVDDQRWLLASARVDHGSVFRRGCVARLVEQQSRRFQQRQPLHWPGRYDDIEVPNLFELDGRWYLVGSIQEDIKVHYWYAEQATGPYRNFSDNVLLPRGNYAARSCRGLDDQLLVWCFLSAGEQMSGVAHTLPPPKQVVAQQDGQLRLRSFSGFDTLVERSLGVAELLPARPEPAPAADEDLVADQRDGRLHLGCPSGFRRYLLRGRYGDFRLRVRLRLTRPGKCGLFFRVDEEGSGYIVSLDVTKGLAQIRAWGRQQRPGVLASYRYHQLQAAYFYRHREMAADLELVAHGRYIELSVNGWIELSLADDRYAEGAIGFYTEGAELELSDLMLQTLGRPPGEVFDPLNLGETGEGENEGGRS